jgi:hypothetical protein
MARLTRLTKGRRQNEASFKISPGCVDPGQAGSSLCQKAGRAPRAVGQDPETPGEFTMRVMVIIKATQDSENGVMPSQELLVQMGKYNEELVKAGIMLDGEGLKPSKFAKRIEFQGDKTKVIDGPFAETKELVAGFWMWQVKSIEEAVAWARRIPNPDGVHSTVELRPAAEAEDFGDNFTPELQAQEDRLRAEVEKQRK